MLSHTSLVFLPKIEGPVSQARPLRLPQGERRVFGEGRGGRGGGRGLACSSSTHLPGHVLSALRYANTAYFLHSLNLAQCPHPLGLTLTHKGHSHRVLHSLHTLNNQNLLKSLWDSIHYTALSFYVTASPPTPQSWSCPISCRHIVESLMTWFSLYQHQDSCYLRLKW